MLCCLTIRSVEASAEHEASRREQIAKGNLERQRLLNELEAEKERAKLYELRAEAAAVESTGQAKAEAQAEAERTLIECQSEITGTANKQGAPLLGDSDRGHRFQVPSNIDH